MRKSLVALAALGAFVALLLLAHGSAVGQDGSNLMARGTDWPAGDPPFAGTFFLTANPQWHAIVQLHADGTIWACDQGQMGGVGSLHLKGPTVGVWKRTGPRQTTSTNLCFTYDKAGEPDGYFRLTGVMDWDRGFDTATGTIYQRWYRMDENPLDPTQGTVYPPVPVVEQRIAP